MSREIDIASAPEKRGSGYPEPFRASGMNKFRKKLGDAAGLTQFGVNLLELSPGAWSAQRHWHTGEDEFVYVLEGEVTLKTNAGDEVLKAGDCAGFRAGEPDGHCLVNHTDAVAKVLEVGTRTQTGDAVDYPDIDLMIPEGSRAYFHKDGTPY
jgi:uncharacterized cupin superfamily protein